MRQATWVLAMFLLTGCQVLAAIVPRKMLPEPQRSPAQATAAAPTPTTSSTSSCDRPPPSHVNGQDVCCAAGHADWCLAQAQGAYSFADQVHFFSRACELGEVTACETVSSRPEFARADPVAVRRARARGCEAGSKKACEALDLWFGNSAMTGLDDNERVELAGLLCEHGKWAGRLTTVGYHLACVLYAEAIWSGSSLEQDRPKAIELMNRSCDHVLDGGTRFACSIRLGRAYRDGDGVTADVEVAAAFLRLGCATRPDASFCLEAAHACEARGRQHGDGDAALAACFDRACIAGSAEGCETAGTHHEAAGRLDQAGAGYSRAMQLGSATAQGKLDSVKSAWVAKESNRRQQLLRDIPKLFAECESNRAKLEHWRVIAVAAQRKGDSQRLQEADAALHQLDPTWTGTVEKLREAIRLASDGDQDRYTQFTGQFMERCMCMRSRTGHCG